MEDEHLNSFKEVELAIPYKHFLSRFYIPLMTEWEDILNYFGIIPTQVTLTRVAIIMVTLVMLRESKISFNINLFSKLLTVKRGARGYISFFSRIDGIIIDGLSKGSPDYQSIWCYVDCERWQVPTSPIIEVIVRKAPIQLSKEEGVRLGALKGLVIKSGEYMSYKRIT